MGDMAWKAFERRIATDLSLVLSSGASKKLLCRQNLLGRMVERIGGDLGLHPDCPAEHKAIAVKFLETWMVDAKRRAAFDLRSFIFGGEKSPFWAWWNKLWDQSKAAQKYPLMALRLLGSPKIVAAWPGFVNERLESELPIDRPSVLMIRRPGAQIHFTVILADWKQFLQKVLAPWPAREVERIRAAENRVAP